jgi:hypothetical protein
MQRPTGPFSLKPSLQHCLGRGHPNVRASNLIIQFFFESLFWHSFNYAPWRHLLGVGYRKGTTLKSDLQRSQQTLLDYLKRKTQ